MIRWRTLALDLLCDMVGGILYAVGIYTFAKMANFAPGGLSGLALLMNYLWDLPIGLTTMAMNIPLVVLSYRFVGKKFLIKTMRSMAVCTIFLDLVFPHFPAYDGSPFLAALYSGVFLGAGLAFLYMRGSSSGGTDLLTMSIKVLRPHLSIGGVTLAIDVAIILLGWPVFGSIDSVLYGLAATAVTSVVLDKILYGVGAGKLVLIITSKGQSVADHIAEVCKRGSTMCNAVGTFTGQPRELLLCACSQAEAYKIRSAAYELDPDSFVMISETSEVFGEGFADPKGTTAFLNGT